MIALDRIRAEEAIVTGFRNDTRINRLVRLMEVVRDQTAAGAIGPQRVHGLRIGLYAVMHTAPQVDEKRLVAVRNLGQG